MVERYAPSPAFPLPPDTVSLFAVLRHGIAALGLNTHGSFLSTEEFGHAVNHERRRYATARAADGDRSFDFVACIPYQQAADWTSRTALQGIQPILTYQSASEGIACFRLVMTAAQADALQSDPEVKYSMFEPIPSILKVDSSIHHTLSSHLSPQAPGRHPILADLQSDQHFAIDVYFRRPVSREQKAVLYKGWQDSWSSGRLQHLSALLTDLFPATKAAGSKPIRSNSPRASGQIAFPEVHTVQSTEEVSMFAVWAHFADQLDRRTSAQSLSLIGCRPISVRYHKHGLAMHLPLMEDPAECIAVLSATILSEQEVIKIALTKPMQLLNNNARPIVQSGSTAQEIYTHLGLNGSNQVIGVSDTGIDEQSCYFKDAVHGAVPRSSLESAHTDNKYRKVIQYISYSGSSGDYADGHGSHVSGTLAGHCTDSANTDKNSYQGMAAGAKLAFFDIGMNVAQQWLDVPDDLAADLFPPSYSAGARIHSNSWGGGYFFDAYSIDTDAYMYEHPDFLAFFAAGNSGQSGYYTVISPAIAKNAVAVGATGSAHSSSQRIDYLASFSGNGPSIDGRIKPDIVAPGYSIYSAKAKNENSEAYSCDVTVKMGTSMATPVAAGNAALIREYFSKPLFWSSLCNPAYKACRNGSQVISGVMLKALVLQSGLAVTAYDGSSAGRGVIASHVPDVLQGYGRMDLSNILPVQRYDSSWSLYIDEQALQSLTEKVYNIKITDSSHPLKLTLSWFDPPNDIFASKLLLHDLDLLLESPSGAIFHSNLPLRSSPAYGEHRDEMNNNEQITILTPAVGTWKAYVQAKLLTEADSQSYALVITAIGVVGESAQVLPISWSVLQKCSARGKSAMELDVSLWSRIEHNGWAAADFFTISDEADKQVVKSSFDEKSSYSTDSSCIQAGCYETSLHLSGSSHRGSQLAIPQCNLYLAPFAASAEFCVDQPQSVLDPYPDDEAADRVDVFVDACHDTCSMGAHFSLPLLLSEYGGAGWTSSYYAIMSEEASTHSTEPAYAVAGSMEWGFEELQSPCLPVASQCYVMQFSYPTGLSDEFPTLDFQDATLVGSAAACPYCLNTTYTLATFCTDTDSTSALVTFYSQPKVANLGQTAVNWGQYWAMQRHEVGRCTVPLIYTPPTAMAVFEDVDSSCLSDCLDYEFAGLNETCSFLEEVYYLCDSYSLAMGYCKVPDCAKDCSADIWCYYGAGTVTSCPAAEAWHGSTASASREISDQCMVSMSVAGGSSYSGSSARPVIIGESPSTANPCKLTLHTGIMVVMAVVVFLLVGRCGINYIRSRQLAQRGEMLPMQSEDRTRHPASAFVDEPDGPDLEEQIIISPLQLAPKQADEVRQTSAKIFSQFRRTEPEQRQYEMVPVQTTGEEMEMSVINPADLQIAEEPAEEHTEVEQELYEAVHGSGQGQGQGQQAMHQVTMEVEEGRPEHFTIAEDDDVDEDDHEHLRDEPTAVQMARTILFDNDLDDVRVTADTAADPEHPREVAGQDAWASTNDQEDSDSERL